MWFQADQVLSNDLTVLNAIPQEERCKELQEEMLEDELLSIERALGVLWCSQTDNFKFTVTLNEKLPTRRGILSMISSVYDPLGFLSPFILRAKRILQDLCKEDLGWDGKIPVEQQERWQQWCKELPELQNFTAERCLKPVEFQNPLQQYIHIFSVASSYAYGAVAYFRLANSEGNFHTSFLLGKARLAPLKAVTIPKLELTAATVSVQLALKLCREMNVPPEKVIYHTDSTTVLHFINNDKKRFPVFVANRIRTIRDFSEPHQWRYVDTSENPADDASRGLSSSELVNRSCCLSGPEFLQKSEIEWPQQPVHFTDEALNANLTSTEETIPDSEKPFDKLIQHFSDWRKLKYAFAVYQRVLQILRNRQKTTNRVEEQAKKS